MSDFEAGDDEQDQPFGPLATRRLLAERLERSFAPQGSRADLARATRTVIDELLRSMADDSMFDEAAELVGRAAVLLSEQRHGRGYLGVAEGSLSAPGPDDADAGALDRQQHFADYSPFIGGLNPLAPPIAIRFDGDTVIGTCTYGAAYEGPPGCLHGGFIAAGFDEVLGFAQAFSGKQGMTGQLDVSYRSPTPLFQEVRFDGRLDSVDGRKIHASATLHAGDRLCAEAKGLFISMKPEVFSRLLRTRPDGATAPD